MLSKLVLLVGMAVVCANARADNFPYFRGFDVNVGAADQPTVDRWSEDENLAWKVKVPGSGWSQPIIWGDRVIVTAAVGEKDWKHRKTLPEVSGRLKAWALACLPNRCG